MALVSCAENDVTVPCVITRLLNGGDMQPRLLPGAYRQASAAKGHMGGLLPQQR